MGFLEGSLGNVTALCVGATAMAFGAPTGAIEASVGAAGIIGFVLGRAQKFGPECKRVRKRIQEDMLASYGQLIAAGDGNAAAEADLLAANEALNAALERCVIDRTRLAASAVSSQGFPERAVTVVMSGLGEASPELFGTSQVQSLAYRFAEDVVRAGIRAAVADIDYYRQLEPALMLEMAKGIGTIRDELRGQTILIQQIAARLGIGGEALDTEVSRLEAELNATRADLLALLSDIAGQGIKADQLATALAAAKDNLEKSRAELERLRGLANEVPEIEPDLAAARTALDSRGGIDLRAAQEAIRAARERYGRAVAARREREAVNMARLIEAEASIALARSELLEGARLFAEAAGELPVSQRALAAWLRVRQADALQTQGQRFAGLANLRDAVAAYRSALTVYTGQDMPNDWAMTQNSLGNALSILGKREGGAAGLASLKDAIAAYRLALTVHTWQRMPANWAMTQNNLGNALGTLGEREGGAAGLASLKDAVAAFGATLTVYTPGEMPAAWAATRNNLGNALQALGEREGGAAGLASLKDAVAAYRSALTVRTPQEMPAQWAMTQNNLGNALGILGEREGGTVGLTSLKDAIGAYRVALTVRTRQDMPADWAMTQNNLGIAHRILGEREGGAAGLASLRDAVAAYRLALTVYTLEGMPADWAMTQNNLGVALRTLGTREGGAVGLASLKGSVAACHSALTVRTRREMPTAWAMTQNNLASVLGILGAREEGAAGLASLKEAVAAYRSALIVHTRQDMPAAWAATQRNLGIALQTLRKREGGAAGLARLKDAVAGYHLALTVHTRQDMPADWAISTTELGGSQIVLGIELSARDMVKQGMAAIDEAAILFGDVLPDHVEAVRAVWKRGAEWLSRR